MNSDEFHQWELEQQEWQEMLKDDPEFEKWLNELDEGSERIKKSAQQRMAG